MLGGYTGRILKVDLCSHDYTINNLSEEMAKKFIGGKGFAAKLLYDTTPKGVDPFSADNPLILTSGPLTATAALGSGVYFATKSPLTGGYLDSGVRGHFGAAFKLSGFDAMVIKGRSPKPVYLLIDNGTLSFLDAKDIWGKDSHETETLLKSLHGSERLHIASIGIAGENKVRYSCITCDLHRQAGRGGAGAVMGSKNLKAIVVKGSGRINFWKPEKFVEQLKELHKYIIENREPLHTQGTMWLMDPMNNEGLLPTWNFQKTYFKDVSLINGDSLVKSFKTKDIACFGCSIACSNLCNIKGKFGNFVTEGPEYETAGLLGANCGVNDLEAIAYMNWLCDRLGLDTMSTGVVISFVMELFEKGLLDEKSLGFSVNWGDTNAMIKLINLISTRTGFGDLLADGVKRASETLGIKTSKYAMHVKGMEIPAYDPRGVVGMSLSYATSDRGACHLRAWTVYDEIMGKLDRYAYSGKAGLVAARQNRKAVIDSLGICEQMGLLPIYSSLLESATGLSFSHYVNDNGLLEDYEINGFNGRAGDRIYTLCRAFNCREGFSRNDDYLPKRFFNDEIPDGKTANHKLNRIEFDNMLDDYYLIRNWDKNGKPTKEKLVNLEMEDIAQDLWG